MIDYRLVSGLLAFMNEQGLPLRLQQYLHPMRTPREHIEVREKEFLEPGNSHEKIDRVIGDVSGSQPRCVG